MRIPEWLRLFRKHPEKHLFSTGDLLQLTEQRKDVLLVELTRLVKSGTIERTARGWYSNPFYPPTPEEIAMVLGIPPIYPWNTPYPSTVFSHRAHTQSH